MIGRIEATNSQQDMTALKCGDGEKAGSGPANPEPARDDHPGTSKAGTGTNFLARSRRKAGGHRGRLEPVPF